MVVVIELIHILYWHECFNAGSIYQISCAHPEQEVIYCAEENQIECVSRLMPQTKNVSYYKVEELKDIYKCPKSEREKKYNHILKTILEKYSPTTVVFTSAHYVNGLDVSNLVKERSDIKFILFQHGELEQLLKIKHIKFYKLYRESLYYKAIYIYLSMKDYIRQIAFINEKKKEKVQYQNYLKVLSKCENASIVVFSTEYQKYSGTIPDSLIEKFEKIYLPYVYDWDLEHRTFDGEVKIGILPKTAEAPDATVWKVVEYVNKKMKDCRRPFKFYMYREPDRGIKNVYQYESKGYDRKYLNEFMENCDWLLIPYPKDKYRLSSSGALFDSINMELPVMMYESACFNDFDDVIGIRGFSVKELGDAIIQVINTYSEQEKNEYVLKLRQLKEKMHQSNVNFFKHKITTERSRR